MTRRAWNSTAPAPTKPIARSAPPARGGRIKPKKRSASEYARIYGSRKRVLWVKSQPCIVGPVGCAGEMVNAHTENGGLSRKGAYTSIVPACDSHHREMHRGIKTFEAKYGVDLEALAAATERRWQAGATQTTTDHHGEAA